MTTPLTRASSLTILRRQQAALEVKSSLDVLAAKLSRGLDEKLAPFTDDELPLPNFDALQGLLARRLERQVENLLRVDEALIPVLRAERRARQGRARAAEQTKSALRRIRSEVDNAHGQGTSGAMLGLGELPRRSPLELWRLGRSVLALLRLPDLNWPELLVGARPPLLELLAQQLDTAIAELDATKQRLVFDKRRLQIARGAKQQAIEHFDHDFGRCARLAESLYYLAELDYDAERVRSATRRSRQSTTAIEPIAKADSVRDDTAEVVFEADAGPQPSPDAVN